MFRASLSSLPLPLTYSNETLYRSQTNDMHYTPPPHPACTLMALPSLPTTTLPPSPCMHTPYRVSTARSTSSNAATSGGDSSWSRGASPPEGLWEGQQPAEGGGDSSWSRGASLPEGLWVGQQPAEGGGGGAEVPPGGGGRSGAVRTQVACSFGLNKGAVDPALLRRSPTQP